MKHTYKLTIAQPGTMHEIVNEDGEYLCSLLGNKTDEQKQADAKFILTACNSHAELLEALQNILSDSIWDGESRDDDEFLVTGKMLAAARAAIAKATA